MAVVMVMPMMKMVMMVMMVGMIESHLAPLVRGWRGLLAVRSCSFFMQQATTGCARRGSKKVRLVETRAAWPFQIEGAAGWCRGRAQVAIGAVFPVAAAVAVGPRCPPATALAGLALGLRTSPKLDLMRRMEKKERMRLDEEGRCAARRTREVSQHEQFSQGGLGTCSSRRGPETGPSVPRHT